MDTDQIKGKVTEQGGQVTRPEAVPADVKPAPAKAAIDGLKGESTDSEHKDWIEQ